MTVCACPARDAQRCADLRYPEHQRRRLDDEEEAEPCLCACHDEEEEGADDEPL